MRLELNVIQKSEFFHDETNREDLIKDIIKRAEKLPIYMKDVPICTPTKYRVGCLESLKADGYYVKAIIDIQKEGLALIQTLDPNFIRYCDPTENLYDDLFETNRYRLDFIFDKENKTPLIRGKENFVYYKLNKIVGLQLISTDAVFNSVL